MCTKLHHLLHRSATAHIHPAYAGLKLNLNLSDSHFCKGWKKKDVAALFGYFPRAARNSLRAEVRAVAERHSVGGVTQDAAHRTPCRKLSSRVSFVFSVCFVVQ